MMAQNKDHCWTPVHKAPVVTEASLFPEEDLVLKKLQEKYTYHQIPPQIFGEGVRGCGNPTLPRPPASSVTEHIQLKEEPLTPCPSPPPFSGSCVALATTRYTEMMSRTNDRITDQRFPCETKTAQDPEQQTEVELHGEQGTHSFMPDFISEQKRLHVLHEDMFENSHTELKVFDFYCKEKPTPFSPVEAGSHCQYRYSAFPGSTVQSPRLRLDPVHLTKVVFSGHDDAQERCDNSWHRSKCPEFPKFPCQNAPSTGFPHSGTSPKVHAVNSSETSQVEADQKTTPHGLRDILSSGCSLLALNTPFCNVQLQQSSMTNQRKETFESSSHSSEFLLSEIKSFESSTAEKPNTKNTMLSVSLIGQPKITMYHTTQAKKDFVFQMAPDSLQDTIHFTQAMVTPIGSSSSFVSAPATLSRSVDVLMPSQADLSPPPSGKPNLSRSQANLSPPPSGKPTLSRSQANLSPPPSGKPTLSKSLDVFIPSQADLSPAPTGKQAGGIQPSKEDMKMWKAEESNMTVRKGNNFSRPAFRNSRKRMSEGVAEKLASHQNQKVTKGSRARIQDKLKSYHLKHKFYKTKSPVLREDADKVKDSNTTSSISDPLVESFEDVSTMSKELRQHLAGWFLTCSSTISLLVLYQDNSVNTNSALMNRPKVKGILVHCEKVTYLLPARQFCEEDLLHWIRSSLRNLLMNSNAVKVAFDCKHLVIILLQEFSLGSNRETLGWHFEDPVIAGWLLKPDFPPHTLKELAASVGIALNKNRGTVGDLEITSRIMEKLRCHLKMEGVWSLFYHVEMPLTSLLAVMELQPIKVDTQVFVYFSDVLKKKLGKIEHEAYALAGHPFCINSTQQLRQVLYEELHLDLHLPGFRKVMLTAGTHHKSTSECVLRQLIPSHPLPSVILQYRHLLKLKSTYIDGMLEAVDTGMLTTHWDQTAAATGRLTSCHPNLQAIPRTPTTITDYENNIIAGSEPKKFDIYAREPFICNEGCVFLAADFQQIELRLLAHLTNDAGLKEMFTSNDKAADVFVQLTAQWLSKPCDEVKHAEREQTKRIVYSILYGVGKEKLSEYLKVSTSRAVDIMNSFLVTFPAVQVFTRKCISYAKQYGYTETLMGQRRWLPKVNSKAANFRAQAERQAVNFCLQGSAADLCKQAMLKVEEALRAKPHLHARLLIHIHDELVWELPQDQLKETCELIRRVMEDRVLLCLPDLASLRVPLAVSLSCGTSWAHLKPCH